MGRWLAPLAVLAVIAAGCGDDDGDDDTDTDTTEQEAATTTEAAGERAAGDFSCAESVPDCEGTVAPAEGLTDGATIRLEASGFSPDLALGLTQCADQNDPDNEIEETDSGDCNLRGIGNTMSDADGNVMAEFTVVAGATMTANTANGRTCDAEHDCVVSIGELVPDPDAERITFTLKFT